jgi:hypothetical protein
METLDGTKVLTLNLINMNNKSVLLTQQLPYINYDNLMDNIAFFVWNISSNLSLALGTGAEFLMDTMSYQDAAYDIRAADNIRTRSQSGSTWHSV